MELEKMIENVAVFHQAIGAAMAVRPALLPCEQVKCNELSQALRAVCRTCRDGIFDGSGLVARLAMAVEELAEWVEAHAEGNLVSAADAWGDRLYVLLGDAVATGLPAAAIFAQVHRSNMTKTIVRADGAGKAQKNDGFEAPRLAELLVRPSSLPPS
jgi:predicted HAD superfamily Cof-like phosphohydrolase